MRHPGWTPHEDGRVTCANCHVTFADVQAILATPCEGPKAMHVLRRVGNWIEAGCGKCKAPLGWNWVPPTWSTNDSLERWALPSRCADCMAAEPLDPGEAR